jgi:hypothetical protein
MAYRPTGRPVGRPKTKDYQTFSLKMPTDFLAQVKRYAREHQQTVAELIRDGLQWRITDGDPRGPGVGTISRDSGNTENGTPPAAAVPRPVPAYDTTKCYLGTLCKRQHRYAGTDQSLRRVGSRVCVSCHVQHSKTRTARRHTSKAG